MTADQNRRVTLRSSALAQQIARETTRSNSLWPPFCLLKPDAMNLPKNFGGACWSSNEMRQGLLHFPASPGTMTLFATAQPSRVAGPRSTDAVHRESDFRCCAAPAPSSEASAAIRANRIIVVPKQTEPVVWNRLDSATTRVTSSSNRPSLPTVPARVAVS